MSVSEDIGSVPSESFWELHQYKRCLRRIDDGHKLCTDFMKLLQERCDIEKSYAKQLKEFSKKWNDLCDKGSEYGTAKQSFQAMLHEADQVADLHLTMRDRLTAQVHGEVKSWQKEKYPKTMMSFKLTKEMDDAFRKAQKPWAKRLEKVVKARREYHTACKNQKSAEVQEANAKSSDAGTADQIKKAQERVEKCGRDVDTSRDKYQTALKELNLYNPRYMDEMQEVFQKCQDFEQQRLSFFKQMALQVHSCVNLSVDTQYAQVFRDLHTTLEAADPSDDLRWWSRTYGADMPMNWPAFEEYRPELQAISKKQRGGAAAGGDSSGVTLTYHQRTDDHQSNSVDDVNRAVRDEDEEAPTDFEENGPQPVPMRALYDYTAQEDDELSFTAGDIIDKLVDEDDEGWCKGQVNGRIGLYPAQYCEPL